MDETKPDFDNKRIFIAHVSDVLNDINIFASKHDFLNQFISIFYLITLCICDFLFTSQSNIDDDEDKISWKNLLFCLFTGSIKNPSNELQELLVFSILIIGNLICIYTVCISVFIFSKKLSMFSLKKSLAILWYYIVPLYLPFANSVLTKVFYSFDIRSNSLLFFNILPFYIFFITFLNVL